MKIAITGVTGQYGKEALAYLLEKKFPKEDIIALARTPEKATFAIENNIEVRPGNFDDKEEMLKSLEGIDRILLVSTTEPNTEKRVQQHINVIEAAKGNQVQKIVYTSAVNPDLSPLGQAHVQTENYLKNCGVPYLILRNNSYLETKIPDIQMAIQSGKIASSITTGKFGLALRCDFAHAGVEALLSNRENETLTLSGELTTYSEFTNMVASALNREVTFIPLNEEQSLDLLKQRMPQPLAEIFVENNKALDKGVTDVTSTDLEDLLGHPMTSLSNGIVELIAKL